MMRSNLAEILSRVDSQRIGELAYELVKTPSPTGEELQVAKLYALQLERAGLDVRLDYVQPDRPNVIGTLHGKGGGRGLILAGHLDTIPQGNCVPPRIEAGRVYGRGACDMKGSLAAMVESARVLVASRAHLSGDLILIGWVDHEAPMGKGLGPKAIAKSIKEGKIKADGAVVTEGPIDSISIAQGGMAIFTIRTSSPKGTVHTTTVSLRSNPILWISELVRELHAFDEELNSKPWNPLIPQRPSVQLGIVHGGDFYNRLPAECQLTGTIRWDPGENVHMVEAQFASRLKRLENRLWHMLDDDVNFKLELDLVRESYEIPKDSEIVKLAQEAIKEVTGRDVDVSGMRGVGDPPILGLEAGIPTIAYGPFDLASMTAHSDNEWISTESLTTASKVYIALALKYCS
jgi:acetylornithine deacetylase/succinyl-diaminopimelate desuccinylase-like protein